VKVGHRQAFIAQNPAGFPCGVLSLGRRDGSSWLAASGFQHRKCGYRGCSKGNATTEFIKNPSRLA
ncbi:hypothetical protein, partial [Achromobacter spanius]|uniref:hypothetical protein n=1 Tax=Achromobacter spanius TaxID=217203 RepID=UPI0032090C62